MTVSLANPATVEVGTSLPELAVRAIRFEHILMFALVLRDSNPIHFNVDAVRDAGLGDHVVNQGGASLAYILNLLCQWAGSRSAVQRIECRFSANVVANDDVVASGVVTAVRDDERGRVVDCDVWLDVRGGARAILGTATVLLANHGGV